jgi:hypothetical protein
MQARNDSNGQVKNSRRRCSSKSFCRNTSTRAR